MSQQGTPKSVLPPLLSMYYFPRLLVGTVISHPGRPLDLKDFSTGVGGQLVILHQVAGW